MIKVNLEMVLTIHSGRVCSDETSFGEITDTLGKFVGVDFSFDWIPFYMEQVKPHLEKYLLWLKEASEQIKSFEDWNEGIEFVKSLRNTYGDIFILPPLEGDQTPTEGDWIDHINILRDHGAEVITSDDLDTM